MKTVFLVVALVAVGSSQAVAAPPAKAPWTSLGKFRSPADTPGGPYTLTVSRRGDKLRVEAVKAGLVITSTATIRGERAGGRVLEVHFAGHAYSQQVATLTGLPLKSATNRSTLDFAGADALRIVSRQRLRLENGTTHHNDSTAVLTLVQP